MCYGKRFLGVLLFLGSLAVTVPSFAAYSNISTAFQSCGNDYSVWVIKTPESTPAYAYYKLKLSGNKVNGYLLKMVPNAKDISVVGNLEQGILTMFGVTMKAVNDHEFAPTAASPTTGLWTSNLVFVGCAKY